jgi:two-component system nitrate/nitrite response regulator NarL
MPAQPTLVFAFVTQPIVAEGLARVLSDCSDLKFAGYSADPRTVLEEISATSAGVFLVDQAFGLRIVFDLLSAVKRTNLMTQPILWTREISAADRRLVLEAGARGILDRTLPVSTLLQCLRTVSSGGLWIGDPDGGTGLEPRGGHRLTQREREVVALVRSGLKNREIAQRLSITPGTVKVHLMHVFEKTGARDRFELRMQAAKLLEGEAPAEPLTMPSAMASGGTS